MSDILWSPGVKLDQVEKKIIIKALAFYQNDRDLAARSLGISRRTIDGRIAEYKKDEPKAIKENNGFRRSEGLGAIQAKPTATEFVPSEEPYTPTMTVKKEDNGDQAPKTN